MFIPIKADDLTENACGENAIKLNEQKTVHLLRVVMRLQVSSGCSQIISCGQLICTHITDGL